MTATKTEKREWTAIHRDCDHANGICNDAVKTDAAKARAFAQERADALAAFDAEFGIGR